MKHWLLPGAVTGLIIVGGEALLNGVFLQQHWQLMTVKLSLPPPSDAIVGLAMAKLFVLGFVLIWLYELCSHKFGFGFKSAVTSGLIISLLIWGWALLGLLMGGYISKHIAIVTFLWGQVELPLAAVIGSKLYHHLQPRQQLAL